MREFGGTWSESKLDCVEKYARAYLKVMQNQDWCSLHYVDAFAGGGTQPLKSSSVPAEAGDALFEDESQKAEAKGFLIGSAMRAMIASRDSKRPFNRFVFIDEDRPSCVKLKERVHKDFGSIEDTVEVTCGDANRALSEYIDSVNWRSTRALVFLDPFGLDVGWDLISRLASTKACDVWYLFSLSGVVRMMTKSGKISAAWEARLDRAFGTHDWRQEFYKRSLQQPLLDQEDETWLRDASTEHVVDYLRARLESVYAAVSKAAILRNGKSSPLFALVLGVSNPSERAQKAALNIANTLVEELGRP
jgi:three-Cys-motif partner protein